MQGPHGRVEDRRVLYRELAALRTAHPALRRGRLEVVDSGHPDVLRWQRALEGEAVTVWLNASPRAVELPREPATVLRDGRGSGRTLGPWGWAVAVVLAE